MPQDWANSSACGAISLALFFAAASCGFAPRPPTAQRMAARPANAPGLLPLAAGNEWIYEVRNPAGQVSKLTMRARGERYIESRRMAAQIVEESGGVPGQPALEGGSDLVAYYLRAGFIIRSPWLIPHGSELEDRGAELGDERLLPLDLQHDPAWGSEYGIFDFGRSPIYRLQTSSRLVSASESITVPAGIFERCVRVETTVSTTTPSAPHDRTIVYDHVDWYAPGVGWVKGESFVVEGRSKRSVGEVELVSFRRSEEPEKR
jgi:hypothetical protein